VTGPKTKLQKISNRTSLMFNLVNERRKRSGKKYYLDKKSAISKNGTKEKPKLTLSPFIHYLDYGNNNDGYWTYESMVLQLEDCVDSCLQELYLEFELTFLFNHSNEHDKMKPDGLHFRRVSKTFGGKQTHQMWNSVLTDKDCFGPFHNSTYKLQLGDDQSMIFSSMDTGPFYLSDEEKERRRNDVSTGKESCERNIVKNNLIKMLKDMNILHPIGSANVLRDQCISLDLPITYTQEIIEEGWVGRPKGSLQILYEHG
jgi:hypothetical protein